jgi:hypothetical protein
MSKGYILLYRQFMDNCLYQDSEYVHLWVHLLLCASHGDKQYLSGNTIIKLKPGQFITGRKKLSKETGINESKIERILKVLENAQNIEQQTNNLNRCISIVNWSKFQKIEQPKNTLQYIKIKEIVNLGFPDGLFEIVLDWLNYKSSKGKSYKNDKTIMTMVNNLWEISDKNLDNSKEIVNNSISNNYDGLFPLRKKEKVAPKLNWKGEVV